MVGFPTDGGVSHWWRGFPPLAGFPTYGWISHWWRGFPLMAGFPTAGGFPIAGGGLCLGPIARLSPRFTSLLSDHCSMNDEGLVWVYGKPLTPDWLLVWVQITTVKIWIRVKITPRLVKRHLSLLMKKQLSCKRTTKTANHDSSIPETKCCQAAWDLGCHEIWDVIYVQRRSWELFGELFGLILKFTRKPHLFCSLIIVLFCSRWQSTHPSHIHTKPWLSIPYRISQNFANHFRLVVTDIGQRCYLTQIGTVGLLSECMMPPQWSFITVHIRYFNWPCTTYKPIIWHQIKASHDSSLAVLPAALVQLPTMAECSKGFFLDWSHVLPCSERTKEQSSAPWEKAFSLMKIMKSLWISLVYGKKGCVALDGKAFNCLPDCEAVRV